MNSSNTNDGDPHEGNPNGSDTSMGEDINEPPTAVGTEAHNRADTEDSDMSTMTIAPTTASGPTSPAPGRHDDEAVEIEVVDPDFIDLDFIANVTAKHTAANGDPGAETDNGYNADYSYLPFSEHHHTDSPYAGKRVVDLALLVLVAVPAVIIGLICAAAVRLTSKGPVLFRQERIGIDGEPFTVFKFRTMTDGDNPIFPDASRITKVGGVLRRLSLDELPQLINVAFGQMSIVGPRPTLGYQVERYDSRQKRRLSVRPGLTGLAQVSGRNSLSWAQRIEMDIRYVETQSVVTDLGLVARTVGTILTGNGVEGHPGDDPLAVIDLRSDSKAAAGEPTPEGTAAGGLAGGAASGGLADGTASGAASGGLADGPADTDEIDLDLIELEIVDLRGESAAGDTPVKAGAAKVGSPNAAKPVRRGPANGGSANKTED